MSVEIMKILCLLLLFTVIVGCSDTEQTLTPDEIEVLIDAHVAEEIARINDAIEENNYRARKMKQIVLDSIVFLNVKRLDGTTKTGSGFVVNKGQIVTCHHVIEDVSRGSVSSVYDDTRYPIQAVLAIDKAHDIAIIQSAFLAPSLTLGNSDVVRSGDPIFIAGNPQGFKGTLAEGIISATRPKGFWRVKDEVFQTTAPASPGSSGSPVLNVDAEVIAIHYASDRTGQNLHFAIPANHLKTLLSTLK